MSRNHASAEPAHDPDVIAAIATPAGEGGIGIVRLSGSRALEIADRIFESPKRVLPSEQKTHTVQFGFVKNAVRERDARSDAEAGGGRVDEVILLVMRGPSSYTREDTVEINCHGGRAATQAVLRACLDAGARCAEPGEFTKRAFLNGRIDLVQAETVLDVIRSKTETSLAAAQKQLQGGLSQKVRSLRDAMAQLLSHMEASLDFPDDQLDPMDRQSISQKMEELHDELSALVRGERQARWIKDGLQVVLTGEPNVGKSSLMNRLAQKERVIVSPHPGTTRDTVEETLEIAGFPVILIDTAGIRKTTDPIETQSVERTRQAVEEADLVLFVVDASKPPGREEKEYWDSLASKPRRLVQNKSDLSDERSRMTYAGWASERSDSLVSSCETGEGIESIVESVRQFIQHELKEKTDEQWIYTVRQQNLFRKALDHVTQASGALGSGLSLEFVAADLKAAMDALGEVVGALVTDDILDLVFSQFCIGK